MKITEIYQKVLEFKDKGLDEGKPIVDQRIEEFENKFNIILTDEYKFLIQKHNNISIGGVEIYGIGEEYKGSSFEYMYKLINEHTWPYFSSNYIPFSSDGAGNYYCLDLTRSNKETCPIIFYQIGYNYSSIEDIETCNENFAEWLEEVMIGYNIDNLEEDFDDDLSIWDTIKNIFKKK
jgi:hypothetical protein